MDWDTNTAVSRAGYVGRRPDDPPVEPPPQSDSRQRQDRKRVKKPPKKVVDPGSPEGGIAGEEERDPTRSPGDIARGTYGSTYSTGDE
ncbi:hypothetical protein IFR04_006663 [Cadophora malorum]|uniref:Uncharacterized protein n=1 Tax=Cadophora malorum TaxID=108018 RepID=A0A8H7TIF1_9HELO|nr:hypothetical protein IFR04_006663 [Cadophora malorum]